MKEVFDLYDNDHSGQISIEEINDTITLWGYKKTKNIIIVVHASIDALDFKTLIKIFGQLEVQSEVIFH